MSLFDEVKNNPKYSPRNSVQWFVSNINKLTKNTNIGPQSVLGMSQGFQTTSIRPGGMYFFMYSAKYKDSLPYWDSFPLILPFNAKGDHFWGLNLHYLPYGARLALLDRLMKIPTTGKDNKKRLQLSWTLLSNAARFPEVAPCVKQYIRGYVKSMFVEVPMDAWAIAAMLPVQRFHNGTSTDAHRAARQHISKYRTVGIL